MSIRKRNLSTNFIPLRLLSLKIIPLFRHFPYPTRTTKHGIESRYFETHLSQSSDYQLNSFRQLDSTFAPKIQFPSFSRLEVPKRRRLQEMQQRDHNEYVKLRDFFANLFLPFFLRTHHLRLRSFSFLLAQPRNGRKTRNQKEKKKRKGTRGNVRT